MGSAPGSDVGRCICDVPQHDYHAGNCGEVCGKAGEQCAGEGLRGYDEAICGGCVGSGAGVQEDSLQGWEGEVVVL